ncbi:helix-turn-helix domain-containing protein [Nocardia alni]|uniref:helix-turn-helix domain-containing protein n=1 Tax=Nocardia alni TaxID=2815723 RepID=UPI0034D6A311
MLLRALREDAGWSRTELAGRAHVSKRWLADFENGKPSVYMSMVMDCFAALGAGFEVVLINHRPDRGALGE